MHMPQERPKTRVILQGHILASYAVITIVPGPRA
jgi:hypothetical protein